jgi:hypothetical protein
MVDYGCLYCYLSLFIDLSLSLTSVDLVHSSKIYCSLLASTGYPMFKYNQKYRL